NMVWSKPTEPVSTTSPEPIGARAPDPASPSITSKRSGEQWHLSLIHASSKKLAKLPYIRHDFETSQCDASILPKQHQLPFHRSTQKTTKKGELIHSDLAGPFPDSKGKSKYVLTFLDDLTHFNWVKSIPNKSSRTVRNAVVSWLNEIENKGIKVQHL